MVKTREELLEVLLNSVKEHGEVEIEESNFSTNLVDLGVDSISAVEVANDMEDFLDIEIDDRDIAKFVSIEAIVKYFEEAQK